jgi:flagellar hook-basal body complex protein FliE
VPSIDPISPIGGGAWTAPGQALGPSDDAKGPSFGEALGKALSDVNRLQREAQEAATEMAAGRGNMLDTVVAVQKSEIAFQLVVQVRNKLLEAYQEVMRMQV